MATDKDRTKARNRGYYEAHPERYAASSKRWHAVAGNKAKHRARSRKSVRKWRLKKNFGLTPEDVDRMLASQDGQCVCGATDAGFKKDWAVDHCHETQKIRGLLCHPCNVALGLLKDDPVRLRVLADYLER